ncbi:MAG: 4Fe-4S dicluster domain-containing protein [Candidatus Tectomicrobia bacterium]|nr:4Fe-4S dicluster domain-containing protein [Candidatus Tectomicrobia bacterium]
MAQTRKGKVDGLATRQARKTKKKKLPIAIVDTDGCTGCEICIDFCPVEGCIIKVEGPEFNTVTAVCVVVPEKCIGCKLCERYCPWETIYMLSPGEEGYPEELEEEEEEAAISAT